VNRFGAEEENEGTNKEILMLLAMFHVSTPTLVYKHWLNAALFFAFKHPAMGAERYRDHLKELARAFLYDRYLAKRDKNMSDEVEFYDIIYKNDGISQNRGYGDKIDLGLLDKGTDVENFIFNFLDYILWEQKADGYDKFEFTVRSSVEHYYPQNPIAKGSEIAPGVYNLFGNLCLISNSKNSKLSNNMPEAKKDYYVRVGVDSLKQKAMMAYPKWEEDEIQKAGEKMTKILQAY